MLDVIDEEVTSHNHWMKKMSKYYRRGVAREGYIKKVFWDHGIPCFRPYHSAGGRPGAKVKPVDLVALPKDKPPLLIQVSKLRKWISEDEKNELSEIAVQCNGHPLLIYKINKKYYCKMVGDESDQELEKFLQELIK